MTPIGKPRGILYPVEAEQHFRLRRLAPCPDLKNLIEHYWNVSWDLQGKKPFLQETLPHPSFTMVFEKQKSNIVGVVTGKFSYLLEEKGHVFGVKFRPGAFYSFANFPVSSITDQTIAIEDVFNIELSKMEEAILTSDSTEKMVEHIEKLLLLHLPPPDENITLIQRIVSKIQLDCDMMKVDDVAEVFDINLRKLQRLFDRYVGVSPKWVIQRYRIHEAVCQIDEGKSIDWAMFSLKLGYYDQAHFINAFKKLIGKTPAEYLKKQVS